LRFLRRLLYKDYRADQPQELTEFAQKVLRDIDQNCLDKLARQYPDAKPATLIANIYTPITAVMRHAAKRGMCVVPNFDRPQVGGGRTRWLRPDEAEKFVAACSEHFAPFATFLIGTGCRLSEALYLDWNEVDLDGGYAIIMGPTDDDDDDYQTKNGRARTIPLSLRVLAALRKLPHRTGAVFRKADGEPYARWDAEGVGGRHVHNSFVWACKRAGLKHVHPHMCRHTFATWHSQMGTHQFKLMLLGGWSSVSMVKRYSHMEGALSAADARIIAPWIGASSELETRSSARTSGEHTRTRFAPALRMVGK
jgi:integrase